MLGLWLAIGNAIGSTVILPALHGPDPTSTVGAEIVYAELIQALSDRQISVMDSHDLSAQVGPLATHCSTRDSCPGDIWGRVDGRLVVKGTVVMVGEDIEASLAFFRRDNSEPADHFQATFTSDIANRFAVDAALIVDDLLSMTDDVAVTGLAVAASAAMAVEEDALGPVPSEDLEAEPSATLEADGPATPTVEEQERRERRYMRLPRGLYQEFKQSKMSRDEFLGEKRFRAKKFFVELAPGLVFGDIQRRYTAVARVIGKSADQYYERDQLLPGTAFSLVAGFGYAPTWWMDASVQLGIEFPRKDFISGFEQYASLGDFQAGHNCPTYCDLTSFKPALAVTLVLEPRVRVYARPTGLVKPYSILGWSMRIYDGYDTPDYVQVSYPNRSGIQSFGPTAGLGLAFDTHPNANAYLESSYTHLLGPGVFESNPGAVYFPPAGESGLGMVMAVRAGVGARF